jgi:flagellar M-ring protein FliF
MVPALPAGDPNMAGSDSLSEFDDQDDFSLPDLPMISNFGNGMDELPDLNIGGSAKEDPVERLRALIGERQDETVEILRSWLEDKEESA